jgi:glycosyltransferase involved in cell wall biosynthesis
MQECPSPTPDPNSDPTIGAPTFSIVMPAYNSQETIGPAIESVLRQTRPDFELIIVDDGSTDETASWVQPFLRDKRIRLISQPNLGLPAARNAALRRARGRYVSLLDSDDLWLPRYLETMAATLDANATAAVAYTTSAWILDDATRRIRRARRVKAVSPRHPTAVTERPQEFLRLLLEANFIFVGVTMHRWVLDRVGKFREELRGAEDYELWLRVASRGYRFVRCPSHLAVYRERPGQLSSNLRRTLPAIEHVYRIVVEEYDIQDDLRQLAQRRMQEQARLLSKVDSRRPRRVPRRLRRPYNIVSRIRNFYMKPPREIREAFPNLTRPDFSRDHEP